MSVGQSVSVLDIGGDIGALILYTDASRDGEEIDIIDAAHPDRSTRSQVHRRTAKGRAVWAAVYPWLRAGTYRLSRGSKDRGMSSPLSVARSPSWTGAHDR